jgi:hypothetical protein
MREASEAPDDVGVLLGIFHEVSIAVVACELQAALWSEKFSECINGR